MNKSKALVFILYSAFLAFLGFFLAGYCARDRRGAIITEKTPVVYNIIKKDVNSISLQELKNDAECLYTGFPDIGIQSVGREDYMISASLCERKWHKIVNIKARDSPGNIILAGPFIDTRLKAGVWAQYYRLYGRIGFGGGILLCRDYASVQAGVAVMW